MENTTKPSLDRPCAVCGENRPEKFRSYFDGYLKLYRCVTCNFVAQYPGPGRYTVVESYNEFYDLAFVEQGKEWMYPERIPVLRDIASRIAQRKNGGALLDVGCGDGLFIQQAQQQGFTCTGVEDSAALAGYAHKKTDADIIHGQYSRDMFPAASFDVISFIQVVEHIPYPLPVLEAVKHHLKPGGLLVIEVPSIHAPHFLAYRMTGIKAFVAPPTGVIESHVGYHSPNTMRRLTGSAGFTELSLVTGRWKYKYSGLLRTLAYILDPLFEATEIGGILYIGTPKND